MTNTRKFIPDEDEQLLLAWHNGDRSAYDSLVWKYQKRIFNLALLLTGSRQAAGLAAENAFLAAYRDIRQLRSGRFSSWLAGLTIRECRSQLEFLAADPDAVAEPSPYLTPELLADPLQAALIDCIWQLPAEQRELILLRYGRSYPLAKLAEVFQQGEMLLTGKLFIAQETLTTCLRRSQRHERLTGPADETQPAPHPEIRRNFPSYLDNSAEVGIKDQTRMHLASCGSCREALAELEWMAELLRGLPDFEPPAGLAATILAQAGITTPAKPPRRKLSHFRLQAVVASLLAAVIGTSAYLLLEKGQSGKPAESADRERAETQTTEKGFIANFFPAVVFKETGKLPAQAPQATRSVTVPTPAQPATGASRPPLPATPPTGAPTVPATQPTAAGQPAQPAPAASRRGPETRTSLPPEWGDEPPPAQPARRAAPSRTRSSETAVTLQVSDPIQASADFENAVIASGGRITGRAHSSGNDLLYTRVDLDRFTDLMTRLGRSGRIVELPQPPEDAEGPVELIIKWR